MNGAHNHTSVCTMFVIFQGRGNKRMKLTDPEERVEHDDKNETDAPVHHHSALLAD